MKNFTEKERECDLLFSKLGDCYHLWSPEDFEIIFTCPEDFASGMNSMAVSAKMYPNVRIITFELMNNHIHAVIAGSENSILQLFSRFKYFMNRYCRYKGRFHTWEKFQAGTRRLNSLEDIRNVIVYDNRNGFIVNSEYTPFTYPWGANRYYYNPDACQLAMRDASRFTIRERAASLRSRMGDSYNDIVSYDGYALPLSFCDVATGERLFRDASHYFNKISKSAESNRQIAKEIGERLYYTDDELYAAVSKICREKFHEAIPSHIPAESKIEMAKTMYYEYNASSKQIQRMLKISPSVLQSLGL